MIAKNKKTQEKEVDFKTGFDKLKNITEWFEKEDLDVEEALKKFEDGLDLIDSLKGQLKNIELKVKELKVKATKVLKD